MEFNLTDLTGYLASAGVLISFLMKNVRSLRVVNTIGCSMFVFYGFLLQYSWPIIVTNIAIVIINLFFLAKNNQV
ncbi:MAG: uroporphyrinogen decarboxylase [Bacteroidota bacterium]